MKKITLISFIFILSLTGCGNTISSSKMSEEPKNEIYIEEAKEPETPVEKPTEQPTKVVEEPTDELESTLINSPETPCGAEEVVETEDFSLPNIEDYFHGEDFFDLESYLIDCGAECVNNDDSGYIALFPNWSLTIGSKTASDFPELSIENNVEHIKYYYIPPGEWEWGQEFSHVVNDEYLEVCDSSIYKLPDVIYALYESNFAPENLHIYNFVYD